MSQVEICSQISKTRSYEQRGYSMTLTGSELKIYQCLSSQGIILLKWSIFSSEQWLIKSIYRLLGKKNLCLWHLCQCTYRITTKSPMKSHIGTRLIFMF